MTGFKKLFVVEATAVLAACLILLIPPPEGLSNDAMIVIALLAFSVVNWVANIVPDYVTALSMCCLWVVFKIVPFQTAFNAFCAPTTWLLIGALGIGSAVTKSGLITRISLYAMKLCAPSFKGQTLAMLIAGILISPFIPSSMAKVTIAGKMSTGIADKLGFENRSPGMVGIMMAMYTGFSLTAPFVISSSFFGYMILALMPPDTQQQFTFFYWSLCMIPWVVLVLVLSYIAILILYRPKHSLPIDKEEIQEMLKDLGPVSRDELLTIIVLVICIICWALENIIGINAAVPAVLGLCLLLALNVIETSDFNTKINWSFVSFAGAAINMATVITETGIDKWLGNVLGPLASGITGNPYIFVAVVAIVVTLTRFVIVDHMTCFVLYTVILIPFCLDAGISPWIAGISCYVVIQPFFVRYQNINYLAAYNSAGGDEVIGFQNGVKFSLVFTFISIIGLLASVPYWTLLGLIK